MNRKLQNTNLVKGLRKLWEIITGKVIKEPVYQLVLVRVQKRKF